MLALHQRKQEYIVTDFFQDPVPIDKAIPEVGKDELIHGFVFGAEGDWMCIEFGEELFEVISSLCVTHDV